MGSAIASVVGSVGGAILGAKGAKKAAAQQTTAMGQAMDSVGSARDYFNELQQPFYDVGQEQLNPLVAAIQGTDNYQDPLLAQVQDQASRNVLQNAALSGRFGAGDLPGLMAGAMVNPAMQMRQQRIANLSGLVGMGQQAGTMMGQNQMNAGQTIGGYQSGIGSAQAGATMGKYGAYQNALSSVGSSVGGLFGGGY